MTYQHYLSESDIYMISLFQCMDNAHAVEKMYSWDNLGKNNIAWKTGPYLSSAANKPKMDHTTPYCLRISTENSELINYIVGPKPSFNKNGGVKFCNMKEMIDSTTIISTVAINMQFALLEAFEFDTFNEYFKTKLITEKVIRTYNHSPIGKRLEIISTSLGKEVKKELIYAYKSVSNFRNKLTHEPSILCVYPMVALDVFSVCQAIAFYLNQLISEYIPEEKVYRISLWKEKIERFYEEMDF